MHNPVMRHRIHFALILLILSTVPLTVAKGATAFKSVAWTPQELKSGSACLFAVQLDGSPAKVSAKWMGHDVLFFQGHDGHVWYGLAGGGGGGLAGGYPLDVVAPM